MPTTQTFKRNLGGGHIFETPFSTVMKNYPLILLVILVSLVSSNVAFAQTLTLEGGGGYQPTNITATWGATLQIPIYAGFGIYSSYTRLTTDDPNRSATLDSFRQNYPVTNPREPGFAFPQTSTVGPFWGNQILSAGITYTITTENNFAFDIGAGWCAIEGFTITPAIFAIDNRLRFPEASYLLRYQSMMGFGAVKYKLGSAFSLQGKIAFYGLTHGLAMLGISWHPFNP